VKVGQVVKAQVLAIDTDKRQLRLGMKQLVPSGLDEYIAEHKEGDLVTGRMMEVSEGHARVELGEGIQARCRMDVSKPVPEEMTPSTKRDAKPDLSSLGSMLQARWKGGKSGDATKPEPARAGQILKFRIAKLDPAVKKIELELA
jgi:small subunit ribosomal protein S1